MQPTLVFFTPDKQDKLKRILDIPKDWEFELTISDRNKLMEHRITRWVDGQEYTETFAVDAAREAEPLRCAIERSKKAVDRLYLSVNLKQWLTCL